MKRILSILLAAVLFCAAILPAYAQNPADPRTADVSVYPTITIAGGAHVLYQDEFGPDRKVIYDPEALGDVVMGYLPQLLEPLRKLDFNGVIDIVKEALFYMFGESAMDENGESIADNISGDAHTMADWNLNGDRIYFGFDFRLSPMDNAVKLHEFVELLKQRRGVDKLNFIATSAGSGIMLSYMKLYGYDDIAGVVMNISLHDGISMFEAIATGKITFSAEALGKSNYDISSLNLPIELQPLLRILYESGLLDLLSNATEIGVHQWEKRLYNEILIPLFFMSPVYWTYVPATAFEKAKKFLLKGDDKYARLVETIDRYHNEVVAQADSILLEADKHCKVSVRAGYGKPSMPLGRTVNVQSDGTVETFRASFGATGAHLDEPFLFFYKQKKADGHNHISPDRFVDASTCVLPEQTWLTYNMTHLWEHSYSGWYEWWQKAETPTVFGNEEEYPQYSEMTEPHVYVPRVVEPSSPSKDFFKAVGLWFLKAWRWVLGLPFFWVRWL